MQQIKLSACWLLVAATFAPTALGQDTGLTERLADQADAVIVGEVLSGQQSGQSLSFTLSVIRTIKGSLSPGNTADVLGRSRLADSGPIVRGYFGLWFLKKTNGPWELIPLFSGSASLEASGYIPLSRSAPVPTTTAGGGLGDRMAGEIGGALENHTNARQLFNMAYALSGISQSQAAQQVYARLRTNVDPELKFIGLTGLLGTKEDVAALGEIADNAEAVAGLHTSSLVESAIAGHWNPDPAYVRSLGKIASSQNPDLQRCAAMALDFIHTRDTLPYLAALLYSAEARARGYAVQGLSRYVDNLPLQGASNVPNGASLLAQGPTPYRTPETDRYSLSRRDISSLRSGSDAEYVAFWKS